MEYREELKFICSQHELDILAPRLEVIMNKDRHQTGQAYRIRSLYFDDYYDSAMHDNDAGVDRRYKIRIRVYEDPTETIKLEVKYKLRGRARKESCLLSLEQFETILAGDLRFDPQAPKPLRLLYLQQQMHLMRPRLIVEYERSAYVYPAGNVRVTFDRNIGYSDRFEAFFEDRLDLIPLLPRNSHILEVKYDEFLPDTIAQLLEIGTLSKTAFSKYYLSRLSAKGEPVYAGKID